MENTTLCAKCRVVYREKYQLVIDDFKLSLCPECMFYFKDKIVEEMQELK